MTEPAAPRGVKLHARTWIALAIVLVAINAAVVAALLARDRNSTGPGSAPVSRSNPMLDLLGWIPASSDNRTAFAVWANETGGAPDAAMVEKLDLRPRPHTLGRGADWRRQFGWGIAEIRGWATADDGTGVAVLRGDFDTAAIERTLIGRGFAKSTSHGITIYIAGTPASGNRANSGDLPAAAGAIAIAGRTLVTAPNRLALEAALDAATGEIASLGGDARVGQLVDQLSPATTIMALDMSRQAVDCGLTRKASPPSGQFAAVGYTGDSDGSDRTTLILTGYPTETGALAASVSADSAWQHGFASTGRAGASLATYGTFNGVSQRGDALVAEIVNGRDGGWTRSGIRLAGPVCDVAATTIGVASPVAPSEPETAFAQALAGLPELGDQFEFRAVDLASIGIARSATLPDQPDVAAISNWLANLRPLPDLQAFPADPAKLGRWQHTFGIDLSRVQAVAEHLDPATGDVVAVLTGSWNVDVVNAALRNAGYDITVIGNVTQFSLDQQALADSRNAVLLAGGAVWSNVAMVDGRIYVSTSQRLLREVVDVVAGDMAPPEIETAYQARLVAALPGATAIEIVPSASRRQTCGALDPAVAAVMVAWTARSDGDDTASFALFISAPDKTARVQRDLDTTVQSLRIPAQANLTATPVPTETIVLTDLLRYTGIRVDRQAGAANVVVAGFAATEAPNAFVDNWFTTTAGGCALVKL